MPSGKPLSPKFADCEMVTSIICEALAMVMDSARLSKPKRNAGHIVVLVPSMEDEERVWPNYEVKPLAVANYSFGDKKKWTTRYDEIAQCKALQLWHGRNDGRTDVMPHLLFSGDTPYWGGVKRDGIVVACSGVEPYFDRMISGIIAEMIIGYAYHEYKISSDGDVDFLA